MSSDLDAKPEEIVECAIAIVAYRHCVTAVYTVFALLFTLLQRERTPPSPDASHGAGAAIDHVSVVPSARFVSDRYPPLDRSCGTCGSGKDRR